jgi:L-iditol 2-dehydrogenase
VVLTGIPVELLVPLDFSPMRRKELALYNVRRSNHETDAAMAMLAEHLPRFAAMITHHRPLDGIAEAFDICEHYRDGVGKMIVTRA